MTSRHPTQPADSTFEARVHQRAIEPFWRKLPFLFVFPLRTGPLIMLAFLLAGAALAGLLESAAGFGFLFKGALAYLGLRYGFNILDLFRRGRFEGESVDHTLSGPETRPGKLGLLLALFIGAVVLAGHWAVGARLAKDPAAQDLVIQRYEREQQVLVQQRHEDQKAFDKRYGLDEALGPTPSIDEADEADESPEPDAATPPPLSAALGDPAALPPALSTTTSRAAPAPSFEALHGGLTREALVEAHRPQPGDALWMRLLPRWFWPLVILLSLLLPAATLVIAIDDEFFKALNPAWVAHFVGAMGAAYFVLWAFFLLIAGARQGMLKLGALWPGYLQFPVELGLSTYLAWVLCALLGYTIYQFHQELHLDVDVDFDTHRQAGGAEKIADAGSVQAAVQRAAPMTPQARKVQELAAAGRLDEAIAELKDAMRYDRLDPDQNDQLHALHVRLGDAHQTLTHGRQWIKALVKAGRHREALAGLRRLHTIDEDLVLDDADTIAPLAKLAMKDGARDLAVGLVNGFDQRHPDHPELPTMYFIGARLLSEQWRKHDEAARMVRGVVTQYPDHPVAAEARAYLVALEALIDTGRA